jgi:hypothetical protein
VEVVDAQGAIRGMVVFDNWTANAAQAHMAVDTPIAWRRLLPAALGYVFASRGVLLGVTPAKREAALRFLQHAGFREVLRVKDGCEEGEDLVFTELRREEWLRQQRRSIHGEQVESAAAGLPGHCQPGGAGQPAQPAKRLR